MQRPTAAAGTRKISHGKPHPPKPHHRITHPAAPHHFLGNRTRQMLSHQKLQSRTLEAPHNSQGAQQHPAIAPHKPPSTLLAAPLQHQQPQQHELHQPHTQLPHSPTAAALSQHLSFRNVSPLHILDRSLMHRTGPTFAHPSQLANR
jgi:hypothetical protein